jgi:hypothetical protein
MEHGALFGDVYAFFGAVVEHEFAGGKQIVLSAKEAVFALLAFDDGGEFSVAGHQPRDDARGVRHVGEVERNGGCFENHQVTRWMISRKVMP